MNLKQGAISNAILQAAGRSLQTAIHGAAGVTSLLPGAIVITDGFNLKCQKVFHTMCPPWTKASNQADKVSFCCFSLCVFWSWSSLTCDVLSQTLKAVIGQCLEEAEKLKVKSVSFPAIGTGALNYPKELVSRVLLEEVLSYSRKKTSHHLSEVFIVVHPKDSGMESVSP